MTSRSCPHRVRLDILGCALVVLIVVAPRSSAAQASAGASQFFIHSALGHLYEAQRDWSAAKAAYAKAFEVAGDRDRAAASADLQRILAKEETLWDGYLAPFGSSVYDQIESWLGTVLLGGSAAVLLWLFLQFGPTFGGRWGKNKLVIEDFVDATRTNAGVVFAQILKNVIEQVKEYYRPRDRFGFGAVGAAGSMTLVRSPDPGPLIELLSAFVSAEVGKVSSMIRKRFLTPEYRIDGTIQCVHRNYRVWLRLNDLNGVVVTWDRGYPSSQYGHGQEQLAYEVAMFLKDRV